MTTSALVGATPYDNAAMKWYWFPHKYDYTTGPDPRVDPDQWRTLPYLRTGLLSTFQVSAGPNSRIDGYNRQYHSENETQLVQGYFHAREAGTHRFYSDDSLDNQMMMYHGDNALGVNPFTYGADQDWSYVRTNTQYLPPTGEKTNGVILNLQAGELVPIVFIFINGLTNKNIEVEWETPTNTYFDTNGWFIPPCEEGSDFVNPHGTKTDQPLPPGT